MRVRPTVRTYDPTDRDAVLVVLEAGLAEQAKAAGAVGADPVEYRRRAMDNLYDEEKGTFKNSDGFWVSELDGEIVGMMQLTPRHHPRSTDYAQLKVLGIQELDAWPKCTGAGTVLLDKAKSEARRQGRCTLLLYAVQGSKACESWYPNRGFNVTKDDGKSVLVGMNLAVGPE